MALRGIDFLIYINTGTEALPVWTVVGGQRSATINRASDTIETTAKTSQGYKEFVTGFKEWSIEADGLIVPDDTGYSELESAYLAGDTVHVQLLYPSGDYYDGTAVITDFPMEVPYDDMATYSVTLQGTGALALTSV